MDLIAYHTFVTSFPHLHRHTRCNKTQYVSSWQLPPRSRAESLWPVMWPLWILIAVCFYWMMALFIEASRRMTWQGPSLAGWQKLSVSVQHACSHIPFSFTGKPQILLPPSWTQSLLSVPCPLQSPCSRSLQSSRHFLLNSLVFLLHLCLFKLPGILNTILKS